MLSRLLILLLWVAGANAATFVLGKDIKTNISNRDYNRIAFAKDKINQAFFKSSDFMVKLDEVNGQLFILPKDSKSKYPLSLTVTSLDGHTQQFFLTPKDIQGQTILLEEPPKPVSKNNDAKLQELMDKLIKDRVKLTKQATAVPVVQDFKLKRLGMVKFSDDIQGHMLTLQNISQETKEIEACSLWRDTSLALAIAKPVLEPSDSTKVFMLTKGDF
jgi:hypothetical protein